MKCPGRWLIPAVAVPGFTLLVYLPFLLQPGTFPILDDLDLFLAFYESVRKTILEYAQFPFWAPWLHGGTPLAANPQVALTGLELPCILLFGTWYGWRVAMVLYLLTGAVGMYFCLGDYVQDRLPRSWGAMLFAASGGIHLHLYQGHWIVAGVIFLPWLVWLIRHLPDSRGYALAGGLTAGLMLNHSLHYFTLMNTAVALAFFLPLWYRHRRDLCFYRRAALAAAAMLAMAGYRLVTTLELLGNFPRRMDLLMQIPVGRFLRSLLVPGIPIHTVAAVGGQLCWEWHEIGCYTGIIAAGFFLLSLRRPNWRHFGALICLLLLLDATRPWLPGWWLRHIPPFTSFFAIARWKIPFLFFFVLTAAPAFAEWKQRYPRPVRLWYLLAGLSLTGLLCNNWYTWLYDLPRQPESALFERAAEPPHGPILTVHYNGTNDVYASVVRNLSRLDSYEPLLGYDHWCVSPRRPAGHPGYAGEFLSENGTSRQTFWSPNEIRFSATASDRIYISQNPGSWWRLNGRPLFPEQRDFEEDRLLIFACPPGDHVLTLRPPRHETALLLTLAAWCATAVLWRYNRKI
ncbi:MAG: hypothetical protein IJC73_01935 [Lentisphaeria bacterium]|nr:hypothetical protein [Lentisphaeria bacterium]